MTPPPRRTREQIRQETAARDVRILRMISEGLVNWQIAQNLFLGESTIRDRVRSLHDMHGARNRAHLVGIAFRKGILP